MRRYRFSKEPRKYLTSIHRLRQYGPTAIPHVEMSPHRLKRRTLRDEYGTAGTFRRQMDQDMLADCWRIALTPIRARRRLDMTRRLIHRRLAFCLTVKREFISYG